jgi:diguanylate cyclase (GGDEF)-like protein
VLAAEALSAALAVTTCAATAAAWQRERARVHRLALALRLARARETAFVDAARSLGLAARGTAGDVRSEIERAIRLIAPPADVVLIFDVADDALVCAHASGARAQYFEGVRLPRDGSSLAGVALAAGHRMTLEGSGVPAFHPGDIFAVAVPMTHVRAVRCVVYVSAPVRLDPPTVDALVTVIDHASIAYGLAVEREQDRRRAEYDALTGLLAPRVLRERLAASIEQARFAPRARLSLLFVDTDHFKAWNDRYGHACGDALLRALARLLRAAAQPGTDIAARNGGDEFCLVFGDCEKSAAVARAEDLRRTIAALDTSALRPPGAPDDLRITASIGVAAFPADAPSASELLERADAAMYASKRAGRNRVSYAGAGGELLTYPAARVP